MTLADPSPQDSETSADPYAQTKSARSGQLRHLFDLAVSLAIAVILFRSFEIEGYMISTGSMAPSLLGYHKRVVCPSCEYRFAYGVAFDESVQQVEASELVGSGHQFVTCPNCGQHRIDVSSVPRNQGDQLLVHKHAFAFQEPARWQVVVFRNPQDPQQVYVKRLIGLPGERVQLIGGDVFANGARQRKSLATQKAIRIPVFDHNFSPAASDDWQPRWSFDDEQHWRTDGADFIHHGDSTEPHNLAYRHWMRSGGDHLSWVSLAEMPVNLEQELAQLLAGVPFDIMNSRERVRYDALLHRLECRGVMPPRWQNKLKELSSDPDYLRAVSELARKSRYGHITDQCSYNDVHLEDVHHLVRDVMFECRISSDAAEGQLSVEMSDGVTVYALVLDFDSRMMSLIEAGRTEPLRTAPWPDMADAVTFQLTMSLFDRQVLVAINDQQLFDPVELMPIADDAPAPTIPVQVTVRRATVRISQLALYRDVYYTRGHARHGVDEPYQLGPESFFVLGDNSPVSSDSRNWPDGDVPRDLLVGRPVLVHLPSKPGRLSLGGYSTYIRLPDFSRIRYIR